MQAGISNRKFIRVRRSANRRGLAEEESKEYSSSSNSSSRVAPRVPSPSLQPQAFRSQQARQYALQYKNRIQQKSDGNRVLSRMGGEVGGGKGGRNSNRPYFRTSLAFDQKQHVSSPLLPSPPLKALSRRIIEVDKERHNAEASLLDLTSLEEEAKEQKRIIAEAQDRLQHLKSGYRNCLQEYTSLQARAKVTLSDQNACQKRLSELENESMRLHTRWNSFLDKMSESSSLNSLNSSDVEILLTEASLQRFIDVLKRSGVITEEGSHLELVDRQFFQDMNLAETFSLGERQRLLFLLGYVREKHELYLPQEDNTFRTWSVSGVSSWLREVNCGSLSPILEELRVDGITLATVSRDTLVSEVLGKSRETNYAKKRSIREYVQLRIWPQIQALRKEHGIVVAESQPPLASAQKANNDPISRGGAALDDGPPARFLSLHSTAKENKQGVGNIARAGAAASATMGDVAADDERKDDGGDDDEKGAGGKGGSGGTIKDGSSPKEAPSQFLCPITLVMMEDPVLCKDGSTYERSGTAHIASTQWFIKGKKNNAALRTIEAWIAKHGTSPISRERLRKDQLFPNRALKEMIERFREQKLSK
eukprot:jgi/Bigna1/70791/fgenesh1_pg.13_\